MEKPRSSVERYKLEKMIKELESKQGRGTELISLYIPPGRQISDIMNVLRQEYSQASNIKDRTTRHHVLDALTSCMQRLKLFKQVPKTGLVIFCGYVSRGVPGDEKLEVHLIIPPEPIKIYLYRCDSKFYVEPLKDFLAEKEFYGLIVLDRQEATFAILKGRRLEIVEHITSGVPGKHDAGGQSQRRFERIIEQMAHEFYKRIAEYAEKIFLKQPINLSGIIVGGPGPTKYDFVKGKYLHYQLQNKIIGVVDIGYTGEAGIYELVKRSRSLLENVQYIREKQLVQKFLQTLVKNSDLVAYGIKEVRELLERGAVDLLLISTDLDLEKIDLVCPNCSYEKVLVAPRKEETRILSEVCPNCSSPLVLKSKEDLIDELISLAEKTGATVELISTETEEGEELKRAFGGVAAILRYRVTS
ncbi:MAG: peptide chain release factor 1 [Candidatus Methanomethylicota archaeon]|uniref:Peptide chain release factor subunit 1 n=1 Tax=Thermoproteota archaeon TaxID=2056631 RepID=A0A497EYN8_9CREN|nr:MAG: peptide chain release factor 1 [Candidatus Verstraetearchaeota archaeon]RLE53601.1 MAG: peptide chain release factor 1 [Candidatus Verstraetearchaeota archaeon]